MTVEEIIKKIKLEAKKNSKNETTSTDENIEESFVAYESDNVKETVLFIYAKKIGKYLQKKGLNGFVNFVRRNINVQQYSCTYKMRDFTKYHDEEFIEKAYQLILNRDADSEGKNNYLHKLRDGIVSKEEIVALLHFSKEGKQQKINIQKARTTYFLAQSYKVPVVGYLIKSGVFLSTLPSALQQIRKNQSLRELNFVTQIENHQELNTQNLELKGQIQEIKMLLQETETTFNKEMKVLKTLMDTKVNKENIDAYFQSLNTAKEHIQLLVDEVKKRLPNEVFTKDELSSIRDEEQHLLDGLYLNFEDKFRGTKAEIKQQVEVYLPYVQNVPLSGSNKEDLKILDVGCGRGEWLELLSENGYTQSTGIDLNRVMVAKAKQNNRNVIEADVVDYLKSLKEDTLSVITGFHIIEHLPFEVLMSVFQESFRVLKKQGMIIFETPNPRNILVGSSDFYLDPTHKNPIHPMTLKFLVEQTGFSKVDSMILKDGSLTNFDDLEFNDLNDYVSIGRDLSVIAYK